MTGILKKVCKSILCNHEYPEDFSKHLAMSLLNLGKVDV
jgi:hypothetical protein